MTICFNRKVCYQPLPALRKMATVTVACNFLAGGLWGGWGFNRPQLQQQYSHLQRELLVG